MIKASPPPHPGLASRLCVLLPFKSYPFSCWLVRTEPAACVRVSRQGSSGRQSVPHTCDWCPAAGARWSGSLLPLSPPPRGSSRPRPRKGEGSPGRKPLSAPAPNTPLPETFRPQLCATFCRVSPRVAVPNLGPRHRAGLTALGRADRKAEQPGTEAPRRSRTKVRALRSAARSLPFPLPATRIFPPLLTAGRWRPPPLPRPHPPGGAKVVFPSTEGGGGGHKVGVGED